MPLPPTRRHALLLGLALALTAAPAARATTLVARPLDAMIREADAVALVTTPDAVAARARWVDGRIVTDVEVSVVEALRGDLAVGPLTLRLPGGTVGNITQRLPGAPAFAPGGTWVVLLHRTADGAYTVFDLCLGQLPITLDPATRDALVRPAPAADVTLIADPRAVASAASALPEIPAAGMRFDRFAALVRALPR
ncbi:MAG: hypothetical protein JWM10_4488 [Myxococcaceae bacterium]|nr:hypothetical protein [Myxococcaceae bacterium]